MKVFNRVFQIDHIRILIFPVLCSLLINVNAQGPHTLLISLTKQEAKLLSSEMHLNEQDSKTLSNIYVKHALAVEDLIVEGDPEINLIKEVKTLEKLKQLQIEALLTEEELQLYEYKKEQNEIREASEFDSLQTHLNDPEFNNAVIEYFDENVSPYLTYYHQTYFKPALKQKHYFKINQNRAKLNDYKFRIDSLKAVDGLRFKLDDELERNIEGTLKDLKRLRKKYRSRLDYINVAMGPVVREWNNDYIKMVQQYYKDDAFQRIESYGKYLNAYGINYLVGEFSLLLYDIYYPRSYVEDRDVLIEMLRAAN